MYRWLMLVAGAMLTAGCDHSDAFLTPPETVGPVTTGPEVQLTFNPDQDYWPTWTEDGKGILYSFVEPGPNFLHRCIGLLPSAGGTRLWQLCDNRFGQMYSASSFEGYALNGEGRLLYVEAVSPRGGLTPASTTLWLAATATPFKRQALLSLPLFVDGTMVSSFADLTWTGPNSFMALGQQLIGDRHCTICVFASAIDTEFVEGSVVRGTVAAGTVSLTSIAGTEGATGYSMAENGGSIVFTRRDDLRLFKVPAPGGSAVPVAVVTGQVTAQLLGVSCQGSSCAVALAPVVLTHEVPCPVCIVYGGDIPPDFSGIRAGPIELRVVSLVTGAAEVVRTSNGKVIFATPQISPISHDIVVQIGGVWGHLQTFAGSPPSDLFLVTVLLPSSAR